VVFIHGRNDLSLEGDSPISMKHEQLASNIVAVQMSLYSIAAEYNGSLKAAHAHIQDERYDERSVAELLY